ncbi:rRNA maturation RNase YbeY [Pelistega ratti]|uniref:rRNA maturation RNase YbeY n=1 Tax=Pelistega ratti TaxID=2652177 RepID=UPI001356D943|nr:rRNA maturation RNase YbeY [Pelistega ratti]
MLQFSVQYTIEIPELTRQQLRSWAYRAVKKAHQHIDFDFAELTLRFVEKEEAIALNKAYRSKDYPPNVLTFEYGVDELGTIRGDIVICLPILQEEAKQQHKTLKQHTAHLLIHGVLHALGYDHMTEEEAEEMEALEIEILKEAGFPNPYEENHSFLT